MTRPSVADGKYFPMNMHLSGAIMSHISDLTDLVEIKNHISKALEEVGNKLLKDAENYRQTMINNPKSIDTHINESEYFQNYGQFQLKANEETAVSFPNFSNDPWLNTISPKGLEIFKGYVYAWMKITKEFNGEQIINLPSGVISFKSKKK